jgi:hypothetical protein
MAKAGRQRQCADRLETVNQSEENRREESAVLDQSGPNNNAACKCMVGACLGPDKIMRPCTASSYGIYRRAGLRAIATTSHTIKKEVGAVSRSKKVTQDLPPCI